MTCTLSGLMVVWHLFNSPLKWKHVLQIKKQQRLVIYEYWIIQGTSCPTPFLLLSLGRIHPPTHTHSLHHDRHWEWERGGPSWETQMLHILLSLFIYPSLPPSSHLFLCINTTVFPAIPFYTLLSSLCLAHTPQPSCALPPQSPRVSLKSTPFQ